MLLTGYPLREVSESLKGVMALRDYIRCKECDCKLVPDGDEVGRNILIAFGMYRKEHY